MQGKYVLVVLMLIQSYDVCKSHILTSTYMDTTLQTCVKVLTYTLLNDLCPTYGDYSSEEEHAPLLPRELTLNKWEHRENLIKTCCSKPCTLTELVSVC